MQETPAGASAASLEESRELHRYYMHASAQIRAHSSTTHALHVCFIHLPEVADSNYALSMSESCTCVMASMAS